MIEYGKFYKLKLFIIFASSLNISISYKISNLWSELANETKNIYFLIRKTK